jgi:hypothetical protein
VSKKIYYLYNFYATTIDLFVHSYTTIKTQIKKKKTTYRTRKILYAKKLPKIYFKRMKQRAIITFKRNNTFFNICGKLRIRPYLFSNFYWVSAGSLKFSALQYKGATKTTFLANFAFGQHLKQRLIKMRFQTLTTTNLCFKGGGRYFSAFYKGFEADKKKLKITLTDLSVAALNGCKLKKQRRV